MRRRKAALLHAEPMHLGRKGQRPGLTFEALGQALEIRFAIELGHFYSPPFSFNRVDLSSPVCSRMGYAVATR